MEIYGQMPLPPYIHYEKEKEKRYQTTFAQDLGSAAAPTASLHFSQKLLSDLYSKLSTPPKTKLDVPSSLFTLSLDKMYGFSCPALT